jgi:hypothetical protein
VRGGVVLRSGVPRRLALSHAATHMGGAQRRMQCSRGGAATPQVVSAQASGVGAGGSGLVHVHVLAQQRRHSRSPAPAGRQLVTSW